MAIHIGGHVHKSLIKTPNKILFLEKTMHTVHHHIITFNFNKIEVNNMVLSEQQTLHLAVGHKKPGIRRVYESLSCYSAIALR